MEGYDFADMDSEEVTGFYGEGGPKEVTAEEMQARIAAVAIIIGKPKVAREAKTYAGHLHAEGFDTREDVL